MLLTWGLASGTLRARPGSGAAPWPPREGRPVRAESHPGAEHAGTWWVGVSPRVGRAEPCPASARAARLAAGDRVAAGAPAEGLAARADAGHRPAGSTRGETPTHLREATTNQAKVRVRAYPGRVSGSAGRPSVPCGTSVVGGLLPASPWGEPSGLGRRPRSSGGGPYTVSGTAGAWFISCVSGEASSAGSQTISRSSSPSSAGSR